MALPFEGEELPLREPEGSEKEDEAIQSKVSTVTPLLFPEIWAAIFTMAARTLSNYRLLCKTSKMIWQYCWLSPSSRAYFLLNKKGPSQAIMHICTVQNHKFIGPDIGRVLEIMLPHIPEVNCDHDIKGACPIIIFAGLGGKEAAKRCMSALLSHPRKNLKPEHIKVALRAAVKNNNPVVFKLLLLGAPPPILTTTTATTTLAAKEEWRDSPNEKDIKLMNKQLLRLRFGLLDMRYLLMESKLAIAELAITSELPSAPAVTQQLFSKVCETKQTEVVTFVCQHNLLESNVDPWTAVFMDDVESVTSLLDLGIMPTPIALVRTVCCPQNILGPERAPRYIQDLATENWGKKAALFIDASESLHKTFGFLMQAKFEDEAFVLALAGAVAAGDVTFVNLILAVTENVNRSIAANIALFKGDYEMFKILLETSTQYAKFELLRDIYRPAWPNHQDDTDRFLDQFEVLKSLGVYTDTHLQGSFDQIAGRARDTKTLDVYLSRTSVRITRNTFCYAIDSISVTNVEYLLGRSDKWNMNDEAKAVVLETTIYKFRWSDREDPLFDQFARMILELGFAVGSSCVSLAARKVVQYGGLVDESRLRMVFKAFSGQNTRENRIRVINEEIIPHLSNLYSDNQRVCLVFKLLHESGFEFDSETRSLVQDGFPNDPQVELAVREFLYGKEP